MANTNEKERVFQSAVMNINGNVILCKDNFIQISNITQVWTGNIPKKPLAIIPTLMGIIFGFMALMYGISEKNIPLILIGVAVLAIVCFVIYRHSKTPDYFGLNIELTSGRIYSFTSQNSKFIAKAYNTLSNIMEDTHNNENYIINFGSGTIVNESSNVDVKLEGSRK